MIRPAIDVSALAPLPESTGRVTCLAVRMTAGAPATAPPVLVSVNAARIAGTGTGTGVASYHVGPLFGLLSNNGGVDGVPVPVTFEVHSPSGDGRAQVTVVPDLTLSP
jgi:hypothetical protein